MSEARIPGQLALHLVVSDACREGRGEQGAIDEAVERLRREYAHLLTGWPAGSGVRFHIALTVERPTS